MDCSDRKRVLVLDDEIDVTELIVYKLTQSGYTAKAINDPLQFTGQVRAFKPDLIILDVMMPELSGWQLCRIARADPLMKDIPIILLTALGSAEDRVNGLEIGADDYMSKPFNNKELLLRVRNLLNRKSSDNSQAQSACIQIESVVLDASLHLVTVDGEEVQLTATEFRLLYILMQRKGRVQSREHLLVNVWNYDSDIETRTVDTHVRRVREKLKSASAMIETVRGVGYRAVDF
jgi:two-component system phosphate regulon response regulator PhoB